MSKLKPRQCETLVQPHTVPLVALLTQSGSSFSKAEVCPLTAILPTISLLAREVGDTQQPCILSHLRILRLGIHGDSKGPPFPLHTVWLSRFKILKTDPMNKMLTGLAAVYFLGISSNFFFFLKKKEANKNITKPKLKISDTSFHLGVLHTATAALGYT